MQRREFVHLLGTAAVAGLALGRHLEADAAAQGRALYDLPRFGNVSRFDSFTLDMLDRIAWDEGKTRPEVIRSAVKFLFLKKYNTNELDVLREKHRRGFELARDEE